jgi:hypothetical protein
MARKYICDRCKEEFNNWSTTSVELPAPTYFGTKLNADLCSPCLILLRTLFRSFMESK